MSILVNILNTMWYLTDIKLTHFVLFLPAISQCFPPFYFINVTLLLPKFLLEGALIIKRKSVSQASSQLKALDTVVNGCFGKPLWRTKLNCKEFSLASTGSKQRTITIYQVCTQFCFLINKGHKKFSVAFLTDRNSIVDW